MKATVIYHSADFDGLFCREIARKFLPDAELIGWDFADKPLAVPTEGKIYILDLPCDRVFGCKFEPSPVPSDEGWKHPVPIGDDYVNAAKLESALTDSRIIWIDHHKSSIDASSPSIPGYRIDGVAACRLVWQYFNKWSKNAIEISKTILPSMQDFIDRKVSEPLAVRLAGEYDIWDKRDPDAEVFQFGLRSKKLEPTDWREFLDGDVEGEGNKWVFDCIKVGLLLQDYQRRNDAGMMHRSFICSKFAGLTFLCLNTARCNSLSFASKDVPETGHDALMGFYFDGKAWNFSLYHAKHNTGIDLSAIAVKYGGGGHRGACGFQLQTLPDYITGTDTHH